MPDPLEGMPHRGGNVLATTVRRAPFPPHTSSGGILSLRGRERIPGVPVLDGDTQVHFFNLCPISSQHMAKLRR